MGGLIDLTGKRFGRLIVENRHFPENPKPKYTYWLCRCDCGNSTICTTGNLRHKPNKTSRPTQSCGCLRVESGKKRRTHGSSMSIEYRSWLSMKTRCYNKTVKDFPRYGGRGIKVCERWVDSFENFLADMGPRRSLEYSIERRNNDKDYSPDNCYWGTSQDQAWNKRVTRRIAAFGKMMTILDLHKVSGIARGTIVARLKLGWNPELAATKPTRKYH